MSAMTEALEIEVRAWDRKSLVTLFVATAKRLWPNGTCTKRERSRLATAVQERAYLLKPPPICPECKKPKLDIPPIGARWTCSACGQVFIGEPVKLQF